MLRYIVCFVFLIMAMGMSGCVSIPRETLSIAIEANELSDHVHFLAQPALKGRKPLSWGSRLARISHRSPARQGTPPSLLRSPTRGTTKAESGFVPLAKAEAAVATASIRLLPVSCARHALGAIENEVNLHFSPKTLLQRCVAPRLLRYASSAVLNVSPWIRLRGPWSQASQARCSPPLRDDPW